MIIVIVIITIIIILAGIGIIAGIVEIKNPSKKTLQITKTINIKTLIST